eukprot:1764415-Prymnesium_polylepis.1
MTGVSARYRNVGVALGIVGRLSRGGAVALVCRRVSVSSTWSSPIRSLRRGRLPLPLRTACTVSRDQPPRRSRWRLRWRLLRRAMAMAVAMAVAAGAAGAAGVA